MLLLFWAGARSSEGLATGLQHHILFFPPLTKSIPLSLISTRDSPPVHMSFHHHHGPLIFAPLGTEGKDHGTGRHWLRLSQTTALRVMDGSRKRDYRGFTGVVFVQNITARHTHVNLCV